LVDAFAQGPFTGNPAGVCFLDEPVDDLWLQSVAAEINQAETAFLLARGDGFSLRWFTPEIEVDLCGHATLASAHALWSTSRLDWDCPANFETRSGRLTAEWRETRISMDFPAERVSAAAAEVGVPAVWTGANRMDWFVELESEGAVRDLEPDLALLAKLGKRGVIFTARSAHSEYDFVSRFFAPSAGVPEDAVTGSAHCALGPYWASKLGKDEVVGYQASRRGGVVGVEVRGERVNLLGTARTVVEGTLTV
jgi:PhzF family phenazine biosynthesis protein